MAGSVKIGPNAQRGIGMNGESVAAAAFAHDAQAVETAILVQICLLYTSLPG